MLTVAFLAPRIYPPRLPGRTMQVVGTSQEPVRPMPNFSSKPKKSCMICLEVFYGDDTEDLFPHKCQRCASANFCAGCLKDWFLDACRNESKMPPKCCSVVPLSTVYNMLKKAEVRTSTKSLTDDKMLILCRLNSTRLSMKSGARPIGYTVPFHRVRLSFHLDYLQSRKVSLNHERRIPSTAEIHNLSSTMIHIWQ